MMEEILPKEEIDRLMRGTQLTMFDPPHKSFLQEAAQLRKHATALNLKAGMLEEEAKKLCPHESRSTTSHYHEGGYLNLEYTEYETYCLSCGKVLSKHSKQGSHYG